MMHRPASGYLRFRWIFSGIICLVWFLLLWGLGYLVASKLPGDGPVNLRIAWLFLPVGFFPILLFGAPGMLIGFLQHYLAGAFRLPEQAAVITPPLLWRARCHNNPWWLGLNRLIFFWVPSVLVASLLLWVAFPEGISRSMLALFLAMTGTLLAGVVALTSTGLPFQHEMSVPPEQRVWQGSFFSYLFWRHGLPWGLGNGVLNAVLAIPLFPVTPNGVPGMASALMVSVDMLFTALILCFFMAISAHPQALVDSQLGVIRAPQSARSPGRGGRIIRFVLCSLGLALATLVILKLAGVAGLSVPEFVLLKALAATLIAGAAAMVTAYWTLARVADERK